MGCTGTDARRGRAMIRKKVIGDLSMTVTFESYEPLDYCSYYA